MKYLLIFCTILIETISSQNSNEEGSFKQNGISVKNNKELEHERFVRHINEDTENVIDELLKEVKKRLSKSNIKVPRGHLSQIAQEILNIMKHIRKKTSAKKTRKRKTKTNNKVPGLKNTEIRRFEPIYPTFTKW